MEDRFNWRLDERKIVIFIICAPKTELGIMTAGLRDSSERAITNDVGGNK